MYNTDSFGNVYFPAGISVASIPATTGTQSRVLVPGPNGRLSSATISQLISQSGGNLVTSVFGRTGAVVSNFGSDLPAFAYNTWYMVALRYNGSVCSTDIYMGGTRYTSSATLGGISTQDVYGPSMGLRYNNWIDGYYGYAAGYTSDIGTGGLDTIFNATRSRYGV